MTKAWQTWEGRIVDGRFPLQSYVGGSDHSAVFLTQGADSKNAAIKLISADPDDAEKQLLRWKAASELKHPNLIRIFAVGRCELDGTKLLYVVEEYAEENLSQILPERALTAEETRATLPPVLRALQFLHEKGFVHGRIQPTNILAIGDQVKLSSDALDVPGERSCAVASAYDPPEAGSSTTGDVWQLGMTLVEVLTQRLPVWYRTRPKAPEIPGAMGEPFREIAGRCLQVDAGKRWTVAQISDWLEGERPAPATAPSQTVMAAPIISGPRKESAKWPYWLGLAAVVAIVVFLMARPKPSSPPAEVQSTGTEPSAASENAKSTPSATPAGNDAGMPADESGVVHRVIPEVSPGARRSIHGNILVKVKVKVDDGGDVEVVKVESGRASKYFKRLALDAARDWKFAPAPGETGTREWKLQFAFSRAKTEATAARAPR